MSKKNTTESLKQAFKHEIRLADYLNRSWITSLVVGLVLSLYKTNKNGQFNWPYLLPQGQWLAHNPLGELYLEVWASIIVNAIQAGFGLWGAVLFFLGVYRLCLGHKYVFGCFSLAIAFLGFAFFLPSWTQILLNMIIERYPSLVQ